MLQLLALLLLQDGQVAADLGPVATKGRLASLLQLLALRLLKDGQVAADLGPVATKGWPGCCSFWPCCY